MTYLLKQGGRTDYNYKEYYCDIIDDLAKIDVTICAPGSVAFIIATGVVYILNTKKEWVAQ